MKILTSNPPSLLANPFFMLKLSLRDSKHKIVAAVEEFALRDTSGLEDDAAADLLNPRKRLVAEIGWFHGVSPALAQKLLGKVMAKEPTIVAESKNLHPLSRCNIGVTWLIHHQPGGAKLASWIRRISTSFEQVKLAQLIDLINEERRVSGFPQVKDASLVAAALLSHRQAVSRAISGVLTENQSPGSVLSTVLDQIEHLDHVPALIEDLVQRFEIDNQAAIQKATNACRELLVSSLRKAPMSPDSIEGIHDILERWKTLVGPIQRVQNAGGITDPYSKALATEIRSISLSLANERDLHSEALQLTTIAREIFSNVIELEELFNRDLVVLQSVLEEKERAENEKKEHELEITYEVNIRKMFTLTGDTLRMSPAGISWKRQTYPLDSITRIRWGGVSRSINGLPVGTVYTVAFGNATNETELEFADGNTYSTLTQKLWKALGFRLLVKMMHALRAGQEIRFGNATVRDDGVTLIKTRFLRTGQPVNCTWDDLSIHSSNGEFHITSKAGPSASLSYIKVPNTHVLERAMTSGFQRGIRKLSDVLL